MDEEFFPMIQDILDNPVFQQLKDLSHHGPDNSVYEHSLATARRAYRLGKGVCLKEDELRSLTRAALLHDFFGYDWHDGWYKEFVSRYRGFKRLTHMHAFLHGRIAARRAKIYFDLSPEQCAAIASHMFPLSTSLPRGRQAWLLTLADKMVASREMSITAGRSVYGFWRRLFAYS